MADFKKRKDEAAKKQSGEIAPDVDQDGKMINPHNPEFITKVPWYLGSSGPTLKHHNIQKTDKFLSMADTDELMKAKAAEQQRISQSSAKVAVYRKGSCKNCGAMTHKERDCTERPRSNKLAAWKSGLDIAKDEVTLRLEDHGKVSYSTKRDSWQGYDASQYSTVIDKFQRMEDERKKFKEELREKEVQEQKMLAAQLKEAERQEKLQTRLTEQKQGQDQDESAVAGATRTARSSSGGAKVKKGSAESSESETDSGSDYDSDEDDEDSDDVKEFLERDANAVNFQARLARQGGVGGNEMKVTARNLRIREDTPKYLRNLALNSAHYDPKSRSMRANPFPDENPENLAFAGDNFVRYSGDAVALAQTQVMCWEMQGQGEQLDVVSNPSQAELMRKQVVEKKKVLESSKRDAIIEKYGSQDSLAAGLDPRIRLGQTEAYVEYSWDGRVVKGAGKAVPRSKYEEDVLVNNHTAIWGSYYNVFRSAWGYGCCHSLIRNSYCTGEVGRVANDAANNANMDPNQSRVMQQQQQQRAAAAAKKDRLKDEDSSHKDSGKLTGSNLTKRSEVYGEASSAVELDPAALKLALKREEDFRKRSDEKAGSYNSMKSADVTVEDMEAYRIKRSRRDDPMANFVDQE